jgi:predicted RNA-binding protein with RPS1 domain
MTYLKEGTLLQGTVRKIFPYGAQVRIAGTNRRYEMEPTRPHAVCILGMKHKLKNC